MSEQSPVEQASPVGKHRPEWVQAEYERIGRERERASREADRIQRWDLVRVCLEMIAWTALGLVIAGFAFHVDDAVLGRGFMYGGMAVNIGGVAISIRAYYLRGEKRGD